MKYRLSWLIENRVAFALFETDLETEEFRQFMIHFSDMVSHLERVYVIIDARNMTSKMQNMRDIGQVYSETRPSASGFTILIGGNAITRFLAQVALNLARLEVRFAKDFDEALDVLYRMDTSLPPISMDIPSIS